MGRLTPSFRTVYSEVLDDLRNEMRNCFVDVAHKDAFDLLYIDLFFYTNKRTISLCCLFVHHLIPNRTSRNHCPIRIDCLENCLLGVEIESILLCVLLQYLSSALSETFDVVQHSGMTADLGAPITEPERSATSSSRNYQRSSETSSTDA